MGGGVEHASNWFRLLVGLGFLLTRIVESFRSASSAGRTIPEGSPVRRPRVRDIPKMYYELPQAAPVEQKVYRPPFWSEDTWGTAECVSPKELNKRGLTRTLSGKNLTLR